MAEPTPRKNVTVKEAIAKRWKSLPFDEFKTFGDFFLREEYSDMKIICGDKTFHAHRIVVCTNSKWFKNACESGFQDSSGVIRLPDMDPLVFERVLEFLYKKEYSIDDVALDACTPVDQNSPSVCTFGKRKNRSKDLSAQASPNQPSRKRLRVSISEITGADKINAPGDIAGSSAGSSVTEPSVTEPSPSGPYVTGTANLKWPSITTCPPSYFHARLFRDAGFFQIEELQEQALAKFKVAVRIIDEQWKLELLISEIWSKNGDYTHLKPYLVGNIVFEHSRAHMLFKQVTQEFLDSQPQFSTDFALWVVGSTIWAPINTKNPMIQIASGDVVPLYSPAAKREFKFLQ
ncbi:hypothetical protein N7493_001986 [Penicillium malachiteum]|uniref:BTB domain-containing protein n=1 Tax=Penicillium malachiteum TaxID=1324776 RepID=A0AAD6HV91_9EURO|nr:hypothetical protein N7493_001986 [Penicillium malachiteum]